jgi:hypothetical protein
MKRVNSIDVYSEELLKMNGHIHQQIKAIELRHQALSFGDDLLAMGGSLSPSHHTNADVPVVLDDIYQERIYLTSADAFQFDYEKPPIKASLRFASHQFASSGFTAMASVASTTVPGVAGLLGTADGSPREAGFVTFSNLSRATQVALQ